MNVSVGEVCSRHSTESCCDRIGVTCFFVHSGPSLPIESLPSSWLAMSVKGYGLCSRHTEQWRLRLLIC